MYGAWNQAVSRAAGVAIFVTVFPDVDPTGALSAYAQRRAHLGAAGRGHMAVHQAHGAVHQHTGGFAAFIPLDLAALRIGRVARDARELERLGVVEARVPAAMVHGDRMPRGDSVEVGPRERHVELGARAVALESGVGALQRRTRFDPALFSLGQ